MEPERRPVALISPEGDAIAGEFLLWAESPHHPDLVQLAIAFDGQQISREADDFFTALLAIRSDLSARGLMPRCYGASRNVYPSGMSQGMGAGAMAYQLLPGRRGRTVDLIDIFDDGPDVDPVAAEVQEAYYRDWLESITS